MATTNINITTTKTPATDTNFSEQAVNSSSGPAPVLAPGVSLESHAIQPVSPKNVAVWNPMTTFEADLKTALINFIDTTMEGVKYTQDFNGRSKQFDFFYYGTDTKSIKPAEIGHFSLIFSYPPNITNQATNINSSVNS
jgi:hypothetical protein